MTEISKIYVPDIGDFSDVPVIEIPVAVGDAVKTGDSLLVLESDKATLDVPSEMGGTVVSILVTTDDVVNKGSLIMTMEVEVAQSESGDTVEAVGAVSVDQVPVVTVAKAAEESVILPPPPLPVVASDSRSQPGPSQNSPGPVYASPSVRRRARTLGVEIGDVTGSGPKGRITAVDVDAYVKSKMTGQAGGAAMQLSSTLAAIPDWPMVDFAKFGPVQRTPLSRIGKISGPALARNALLIPHVTSFDKSDVTDIEEFRQVLNSESGSEDAKITLLSFVVKAVVAALREYPDFNSSLDGEELVHKHYWNIGFAADTPEGLLVPVIKQADQKGLREIAGELAGLSSAARAGKLQPTDMQGATFTISSLGGIGGTSFTPIINAPEVAILGLARSEIQPVWNGTDFSPRRIQPLSLSFDHRVVDGVAAARFLALIAKLLSDFRRIAI